MKKYFFENCDKAISQANFSASKLCEIQIPVPEKKTELMKVSEPIKSQLQAINQLPASILNDVFGQYQIILTSIERGYDAVNLRSSAFICGSFLIYISKYNYYLCLMKKGLEHKLLQWIFRLSYGISVPSLRGISNKIAHEKYYVTIFKKISLKGMS